MTHNEKRKAQAAIDTRIGERIAELLWLEEEKRGPEAGRYKTRWGTKTPLGLSLTIKRIIKEGS